MLHRKINDNGGTSMKVMALDYGDARTGVAVSDATGMIVGFTTVIAQWNREKTLEAVADLVETHKPDRLIMGFPRNMDGTEGPRAALYREFAALVQERTGMEVILWDERRTTIEAHNILSANGKKTKKHKKNVDAVAASLILEGYLRFLG
jgi:putative Holliday junction resolvase